MACRLLDAFVFVFYFSFVVVVVVVIIDVDDKDNAFVVMERRLAWDGEGNGRTGRRVPGTAWPPFIGILGLSPRCVIRVFFFFFFSFPFFSEAAYRHDSTVCVGGGIHQEAKPQEFSSRPSPKPSNTTSTTTTASCFACACAFFFFFSPECLGRHDTLGHACDVRVLSSHFSASMLIVV